MLIQEALPNHPGGGLILPIEGGTWLVTLSGRGGVYPPTDLRGFLEYSRSLRTSALFEAIKDVEPIGPIYSYRATENRLRHYDQQEDWPEVSSPSAMPSAPSTLSTGRA